MSSPVKRGFALPFLTAVTLSVVLAFSSFVGISATQAATPPETGGVTSVPYTPGKGQGTGQWGVVGDIETRAGDDTYNYGVTFDADGALWVTDSGKLNYSTRPTTQEGTPRVFKYAAVDPRPGANDLTTYDANGTYTVDGNGRGGTNDGLGALYQSVGDRTVISDPFGADSPGNHGPRGIATGPNGDIWVVDSDDVSQLDSVGMPAEQTAIKIFTPDGRLKKTVGYVGSGSAWWSLRNMPGLGIHFFPVGIAKTTSNTMLVTDQTGHSLKEYDADGNFIRSIDTSQPDHLLASGDTGLREP